MFHHLPKAAQRVSGRAGFEARLRAQAGRCLCAHPGKGVHPQVRGLCTQRGPEGLLCYTLGSWFYNSQTGRCYHRASLMWDCGLRPFFEVLPFLGTDLLGSWSFLRMNC